MPRARLGELHRELFGVLVERAMYKDRLSPEDAKDKVQDAFVQGLMKMGPRGNARLWFYRVVDNLSLNHRRKEARRRELLALWFDGEDPWR